MEIRVLGDFEFTREVISGVARLFSYDNGFGYASGILLVLYLMWNMLQHGLNPEKSTPPVKEFVFGIVLWLMLGGGGSSAKFDVMLTSMSDPSRFEYIEDVPAIAVVPGWLASNLFGEAREMLEDEFSPAAYSISRGQDPLGALTRMWDTSPPVTLYTNNKDEDIAKTFQNYMVDCWEADQALNKAPATVTVGQLMETDMTVTSAMIEAIKVDYNGLFTRIYLGDSASLRVPGEEHGIRVTCPEAWTALNERFGNSGTYKIVDWVDGRVADPESMKQGLAMIRGTYSQGEDAYAIAVNLFVARMAADGVNTALAADTSRMVFEAYRKHVFEQAGQAEVFKSYAVPVITAMEAFSFFVAPVMMVLTALGGFGLSYIGKYLSLVLYMNLWGFTKVFTDLFTAISVERAYSHASNTAFTFGDYPTTIQEVEGFLSVASTLTVSIPALAMFILYGGAKTLSPFINSASKGSVDGSAGAPSIASSMNAGVRNLGNSSTVYDANSGASVTGYSSQNDNALGSYSFNEMASNAAQSSIETARSAMQSSSRSLAESFNNMITGGTTQSAGTEATRSDGYSVSTAEQFLSGMRKEIAKSAGISEKEAGAFILSAYGGVGTGQPEYEKGPDGKDTDKLKGGPKNLISAALGAVGISAGADLKSTGTIMSEEQKSKAMTAAENYSENVAKTVGAQQAMQAAQKFGSTDSSSSVQSKSRNEQLSKSITDSKQVAERVSDGSTQSFGVSNARTLQLNETAAALNAYDTDGRTYRNMANNLEKLASGSTEFGDYLVNKGLAERTSSGIAVNQSALAMEMRSNLSGGQGLLDGLRSFTGRLSERDSDTQTSANDMKVASALWGAVGDTLKESGVGQTIVEPLSALSKGFSNLSATIEGSLNYGNEYGKLEQVKVDTSESRVPLVNVGQQITQSQDEIAAKTQNLRSVDEQVNTVVSGKTSDIDPKNDSKTLLAAKGLNLATSTSQIMGASAWDAAGESIVGTYKSATDSVMSLNRDVVNTVKDWGSSLTGALDFTGSSSDSRPVAESASNAGLTFNGIAIGQNEQLADIKVGEDVQFGGQMYVRSGSGDYIDEGGQSHPIFNGPDGESQYYFDNGTRHYIQSDR